MPSTRLTAETWAAPWSGRLLWTPGPPHTLPLSTIRLMSPQAARRRLDSISLRYLHGASCGVRAARQNTPPSGERPCSSSICTCATNSRAPPLPPTIRRSAHQTSSASGTAALTPAAAATRLAQLAHSEAIPKPTCGAQTCVNATDVGGRCRAGHSLPRVLRIATLPRTVPIISLLSEESIARGRKRMPSSLNSSQAIKSTRTLISSRLKVLPSTTRWTMIPSSLRTSTCTRLSASGQTLATHYAHGTAAPGRAAPESCMMHPSVQSRGPHLSVYNSFPLASSERFRPAFLNNFSTLGENVVSLPRALVSFLTSVVF
mmetsp:Transcript_41290/g.120689  ORF Transcript_41290/g.120689 Transcript_41290/m.120689 type:complete len:317 (+) Transcript_41290:181-1131(+)